MSDTPPPVEPDSDSEPDGDSDDTPNPYGPTTTAAVAPVLMPARVI